MPFFSRKRSEGARPWLERYLGPTLGGIAAFVLEIVQIGALALAIIIPVRYFLVQPFIVKGESMEPNFHDSEYLIIDELTFRFREPIRGEIVVFHPPGADDSQYYIKRVIGLPGETVEVKDGDVIIYNEEYPNGFTLEETYLDEYTPGRDRRVVGLDEYYLMGDNRDASLDSRAFGTVPKSNVVGRVWIRGLPIEKIGTFSLPEYNQ